MKRRQEEKACLCFFVSVNIYYFYDIPKGGAEMYIKIYTKSQLLLLRNLNNLLKKYQVPKEILRTVEVILQEKRLGKKGFIAIFIEPVVDDLVEIEDGINCYPSKLNMCDDVEGINVSSNNTWMTKKRSWYMDVCKMKGEKSWVYAIYSLRLREYYDE